MATAIHHGPPGSYKSFTLVQRFAIPALQAGRVVVTNIRGFDDVDRVKDQFPDLEFPPEADIIWVDTTAQHGRKFMSQWWHWVPFGALIIIDEVQQVYPDRRDFKLESLDKFTPPPGLHIEDLTQRGITEGRPEDVFTAYDKQRHYNWDIYCSTPNIAKVKKEIREVSEWAYRHRDISGLIPFLPWFKHRWVEHQHDPETSGKSAIHRAGSPTQYRADPRVFKCYASTATGEHVKSKAGRSILQDRKLLSLVVLIGICLVVMQHFYGKRFGDKATAQPAVAVPASVDHPPDLNPPGRAADVVPAARPADNPDEPLKFVDRQHALKWSIYGLKREELTQVPVSCRISDSTVKCTVSYDPALFRVALNHVCYPLGHARLCDLVFFVNQPEPEPKDDKKTVLAKSLPF